MRHPRLMCLARLAALTLLAAVGCGARTGLSVDGGFVDGGADVGVDAGADVGRDTGKDTGADVGIDAGQDAGSTTCGYRAPGMPGISQVTCQSACVPNDGCVTEVPPEDEPTFTCVTIQCGPTCSCTPSIAFCDCTGG